MIRNFTTDFSSSLNVLLAFLSFLAIGSGAAPFDCYLALRGSKTLAVRMERAMSNAQ
jgi:cystathionine beta-lyase/cystathionine gamma-synthase